VPGSLSEALAALEGDHEFLMEGVGFTEDFIDNYLEYKRIKEVDEIRLRPHPYEFVPTTTSEPTPGAGPTCAGRLSPGGHVPQPPCPSPS
jgi:hypothetical protein